MALHVTNRDPNASSLMALLLRVTWTMIGNAVVFFAAAHIVIDKPGKLSHVDIIYWAGAVALVVARLVDITRYGGKTTEGEPATLAHGIRYSVIVGITAAVVWLAVHAGTGTFA